MLAVFRAKADLQCLRARAKEGACGGGLATKMQARMQMPREGIIIDTR